jgi:energy-coupling factor transport system ATP-binding protein
LLDRRITELSSGERQRVALAATLTGSPRPVLLDEPTAHLDGSGVAALQELLGEVRAARGGVLLSEQAGWRLGTAPSRWTRLADGALAAADPPVAPRVPAPESPPGPGSALRCRALEVGRGDSFRVGAGDLEVRRGEVVLLTGPNGAGKTTLAQVLAGLARPVSGWVERMGRVALMLPDADLQLFAPTVAAELAAVGANSQEAARVLRRHQLEHLAARAPWQLSRGERQRLVHAVLDLLRPAVMVVDEPGQGLHADDVVRLVRLIHRRAAKGRAYVIISHRRELEAAAHRHLEIRDGRVVEVA